MSDEALKNAQDALLSMLADAREFEVWVDGDCDDYGRNTSEVLFSIRGREDALRDLMEAVGLKGEHMELADDILDRNLDPEGYAKRKQEEHEAEMKMMYGDD